MNERVIYCQRCGAEMKESARYCMKCGALNYNHPDNQNMNKFADAKAKNTYEIGSGKTLMMQQNAVTNFTQEATRIGNRNFFFFFNLLLILGTLLGGAFVIFYLKESQLMTSIILMACAVIYLYVVAMEIIFMKMNRPWWGAIIPIYNCMILAEMTLGKKFLGLLMIVPIVNVVLLLIMFYYLGQKFKKNEKITAFLFLLMIPVIAFGTSTYNGVTYTKLNDKNAVEKDYKRRKFLITLIVLVFLVGIASFLYFNAGNLDSLFVDAKREKLVENGEKIINKTEKAIKDGKFSCDDSATEFAYGSTHYFIYYDVVGDLKMTGFSNELVEASVAVYNNNGTYEYTLTLSDGGQFGFVNVRRGEFGVENIVENVTVTKDENNINCFIS